MQAVCWTVVEKSGVGCNNCTEHCLLDHQSPSLTVKEFSPFCEWKNKVHTNSDGFPKTTAVRASLVLLLSSWLSFVSFFLARWVFLPLEGRKAQAGHILNLFCSQPEPQQSGGGIHGDSNAIGTCSQALHMELLIQFITRSVWNKMSLA